VRKKRASVPFHFTSLPSFHFGLLFTFHYTILSGNEEVNNGSFLSLLFISIHAYIVIEMNERRETKRTKRKKKDKVKMIRFLKTKNNLKLLIRIQFWEDSMGWKRETQEMKIRTTHEIGLWMSVSHWKVKEKYAFKIRLKV